MDKNKIISKIFNKRHHQFLPHPEFYFTESVYSLVQINSGITLLNNYLMYLSPSPTEHEVLEGRGFKQCFV